MDQETEAELRLHDGQYGGLHTDYQARLCVCRGKVLRVVPNLTGSTSACCGAMEQRNGSCMICTSCGSTSACG